MMTKLHEIHRAIDERVQSIRNDHPDWQCSKGCDTGANNIGTGSSETSRDQAEAINLFADLVRQRDGDALEDCCTLGRGIRLGHDDSRFVT